VGRRIDVLVSLLRILISVSDNGPVLSFATDMPPWIFARDWHEAVDICKDMMGQPTALENKHRQVRAWWARQISVARAKIAYSLMEEIREGAKLKS
jgi:hypothetical protein